MLESSEGIAGIRRIGEVGAGKVQYRGLMHLEWNVSSMEAFGTKATTELAREKMVLRESWLRLNLV